MAGLETAVRAISELSGATPLVALILTIGIVAAVGLYAYFQMRTVTRLFGITNIIAKFGVIGLFVFLSLVLSALGLESDLIFIIALLVSVIVVRKGFAAIEEQWESQRNGEETRAQLRSSI